MLMDDRFMLALGILAIIYLLWRMFPRKEKGKQSIDKVEEVINSEEYKVKGQYD